MGIFHEPTNQTSSPTLKTTKSDHHAHQRQSPKPALLNSPVACIDGSRGLKALHQLLGLHKSGPLGPITSIGAVFVAIDFKYQACQNSTRKCHEVGLSKFDTRSVMRTGEDRTQMIKTKTFVIEDLIDSKFKVCRRNSKSGQPSKSGNLSKLRNFLEEAIFVHDGNRRQVVLVGQNVRKELDLLREIGLDLVGEYNPGLLAILDTSSIVTSLGMQPQDDFHTCGLEHVLEQLEISFPSKGVRSAGDNAQYTLRALFGLGVLSADSAAGSDEVTYRRRMETFARISLGVPEAGSNQNKKAQSFVPKNEGHENHGRSSFDYGLAVRASA
ncbi:hypothetical protein GLAREA_07857 [Glarea lozoyensis ATCC 20868]|uniref:Gfd2/YDR514C-like C-terminal domain-containing protein n=1 Tax=Glarea lozoyensis (strain ATCC 20868 / MF5171) TaxID=1116229 RepID=S3E2Q2_GLAL2|nr:uncharacterized protein GLAREA_07857 [Glarea lozoyensis ATCC 20868]EPE32723.1 hypothetical protein GLAREA_07857 [Glarea lozoyensis ATCC 20868]